jgi:hypothetical protein
MDDSAAAPGVILPASRWFLLALGVSKFVCLLMAVSPHSIEPHLKFDDAAEIRRIRIFCNDADVML